MTEINEIVTSRYGAGLLDTDLTTLHDLIEAGKLQAFHIRTKGEKLPWRTWVLRREVEKLAAEGWRQRRPRRKAGEAEGRG